MTLSWLLLLLPVSWLAGRWHCCWRGRFSYYYIIRAGNSDSVCVCVWETLFRAWGNFSGCCGQVQSTRPCCPGSEYSKSFIVVRVRSDFYFLSSKFSECFCRCALAVLVTHTHTVSSNIVLSQPAAETPVRCVSNTNNNIQFLSFWVISFCGIVGIGHYHTRVAQSHGNGMCHSSHSQRRSKNLYLILFIMRFNDIYTRHAYNMAKAQFLCAPGSGCDMIVQSMIFGWTNTPTIYMYMDILIYFHSFASYRHCYGWFIKIVLRLNMNTHFFLSVLD